MLKHSELWTLKPGSREYGSQSLSMQATALGGEGETTLPEHLAWPSQQGQAPSGAGIWHSPRPRDAQGTCEKAQQVMEIWFIAGSAKVK